MINNIDIDKLKKIFVPKGEKFNQIVQSIINWANISGKPTVFPPETHSHDDIYLNKSNTDAYTPTSNYHPATKKYVDDNAGSGGILNKLDATTAPTVNDDSADGYEVGSLWVDVTHDLVYQCTDASVGSAIWKCLSSTIIDDAPFDGKTYGRKNGNWFEFIGTGAIELIVSNSVTIWQGAIIGLVYDFEVPANPIKIN